MTQEGELEDGIAIEDLQVHVQEMRQRFLHVFVFFFVAAGGVFYMSNDILTWMQNDLALELNALAAYEVIYTQLVISALLGFFLSLPVTAYHAIMFMKPGLKPKEYRLLRNYLPLFIVLFGAGSAFAYEFVIKTSLQFFYHTATAADVTPVWGLRSTIGLVLKLSALTGILFQLPIVAAILSKAGVITAAQMKEYRPYFIVGILLVAAVATPPDLVTQLLITAPVVGLYQLSIFIVARIERNAAQKG